MDNLARAKAKQLLDEYCCRKPADINLAEIAVGENIIIEEAELSGHLGRIIYKENFGIMKIDKRIKSEGEKRFVTAHEMGHFFIHNKNAEGCTRNDLVTFRSSQSVEQSANDFAGELLMPSEWMSEFSRKEKPGINLLKNTAEYFKVSISAAALRIASMGMHPVAVIMSTGGKVKWSGINKYFSFSWIPNGYVINNNSYASDIFGEMNEGNNITDFGCNEVLADAWFSEDRKYKKNYYMFEYNIPMPRYNSVLTILWES
jgi:Zn-dependent peptidase ImmA (M78 family)